MKNLTQLEISILKNSWMELAPRLHEMTVYFYNNLYSLDSSLVPAFSDQLELYRQADKALFAIGYLMTTLDDLTTADSSLMKIFDDFSVIHKRIKLSDSRKVIKAFILSAKTTLRSNWTNQRTICWYRLFTILLEIIGNDREEIKSQPIKL